MPEPPANPLATFLASMNIGYDQWREGTGYDLASLASLSGADRAEAERVLLKRGCADWRDVEALARLATPRAGAALAAALKSPDRVIRLAAAEALHSAGALTNLTPVILDALRVGLRDDSVRHRVMDFIAAHAPCDPAVARETLALLPKADGLAAFQFASIALYLGGVTSDVFDWNERAFLQRFSSGDRADRSAAMVELLERIRKRGHAQERPPARPPAAPGSATSARPGRSAARGRGARRTRG